MRFLEVFSGSGTLSRCFRDHGWEVVSIDIDPKTDATIHCDILDWNFEELPQDSFDAIWLSPPCQAYSIARTRAKTPRPLEKADQIVKRGLALLDHFRPASFFIENPYTGLLRKRGILDHIPSKCLDFCRFGTPLLLKKLPDGYHEACLRSVTYEAEFPPTLKSNEFSR